MILRTAYWLQNMNYAYQKEHPYVSGQKVFKNTFHQSVKWKRFL